MFGSRSLFSITVEKLMNLSLHLHSSCRNGQKLFLSRGVCPMGCSFISSRIIYAPVRCWLEFTVVSKMALAVKITWVHRHYGFDELICRLCFVGMTFRSVATEFYRLWSRQELMDVVRSWIDIASSLCSSWVRSFLRHQHIEKKRRSYFVVLLIIDQAKPRL